VPREGIEPPTQASSKGYFGLYHPPLGRSGACTRLLLGLTC